MSATLNDLVEATVLGGLTVGVTVTEAYPGPFTGSVLARTRVVKFDPLLCLCGTLKLYNSSNNLKAPIARPKRILGSDVAAIWNFVHGFSRSGLKNTAILALAR